MNFTAVAFARMKESENLFNHKHYHGAIYLIGYAVEIKLKELMQRKKGSFKKTHSLQALFQENGFNYRFYRTNPWENRFVEIWNAEMRYREDDFSDMPVNEIEQVYRAAGRLIGKINKRMV